MLLLEAGPTFLKQIAPQNPCFSLVHEMEGTQPPRFLHVPLAVALTITCFTLYALGFRDIVTMMGLCTAGMLITRECQLTKPASQIDANMVSYLHNLGSSAPPAAVAADSL